MLPESPLGLPQSGSQRTSSDKLCSIADTVLVVEDEGSIRSMIMGMLRGAGFSVLGALDGMDALDLCAVHLSPIHLMITDLNMPRMNGGELIRRIAKLRPKMKFLCISGNPTEAAVTPQVGVLVKPFTLKTSLDKAPVPLDA